MAISLIRFSPIFSPPPIKGFTSRKSNAPKVKSKIVWIDMEMTGLDVQNDRIMEIACIITDNNLELMAEHPAIVINQPDTILNAMNEWCTTTHTNVNQIKCCSSNSIRSSNKSQYFRSLRYLDWIVSRMQAVNYKRSTSRRISITISNR